MHRAHVREHSQERIDHHHGGGIEAKRIVVSVMLGILVRGLAA
jgi:hypothetical protein